MKRNRILQVDPRNLAGVHAALHEKLERRAPVGSAEYYPPEEGRESEIAYVWSQILGRTQIGRNDDFFCLGGNSIKAVQVLSLLRTQFGIETPFSSLFEAPVLRDFAARTGLVDENEVVVSSGIDKVVRGEPLPLSPAQERVWFLSQLGDDSAYNIPLALHLKGIVQPAALSTAVRQLVERHESLRTSFVEIEARPHQVIHDNEAMHLEVHDFRANPNEWIVYARREASRRFDLTAPPLLRVQLLALADTEHVLLVTMHHIVSDAWSLGIVVKELAQLYALAIVGDVKTPFSPLPLQLADVAVWQRQRLSGGALEADRDYWRETLSGMSAVLELPFDRPRPRIMPPDGSQLDVVLDVPLTRQLSTLAAAHGATLFMVLLAAFKVLLYRYSGSTDISVGTPVAGRDHTELENVVGFLANTIVLRTSLQPEQSFKEHLAQVKTTTIAGLTHHAVPFEQVVQDVAPQRSQAYTPLFQVMFILQNTPNSPILVPGVELQPLPIHAGSAKFDLTCSVQELEGRLHVNLEYSTALFDRSTISRLAKHYEALLESIVEAPETSIGGLSLLSGEERQQIILDWNHTNGSFNQERIHLQVAWQATISPERVAVVHRGIPTTYQQLDKLADAIALHLRAAGAGPGALVGLCLERGPHMVAAMLAVWKSHAAYVPLDPNYPQERLLAMIGDAKPVVILTQKTLVHRITSDSPLMLIDELPDTPDFVVQAAGVVPSETAYVIYTSGSTGRPKGVMVGHRSLSNFLAAMQQHLTIEPEDTWLAVTSLSFDIAVLELLLPLIHGATVVIAGTDEAVDGLQLRDLIRTHDISMLQATPATWLILRESGTLPHRLRVALCGGEAWGPPLVEYLVGHAHRVLNVYGPTETTVWSTLDEVRIEQPITLGRPIANTEMYILDACRQPVPIGVAGDLYIGGAGLALGYLNRPELTAERFVDHPFYPTQARLYITGDRAKYLEDGRIMYLGRSDNQVKLRGFRIELGEVECVLLEHSAVVTAVAVLVETLAGKHLAAFIVCKEETRAAESMRTELATLARSRLPDYMVPTAFHMVAEIPLTPNGKTDRIALTSSAAQLLPTQPTQLAATPTEQTVCALVAELVGRENVSPSDSFFDVGGHSLLGMRLLARVNDIFGVRVSVRELFDHPTPRQLASIVDQQQLLESLTHSKEKGRLSQVEEF